MSKSNIVAIGALVVGALASVAAVLFLAALIGTVVGAFAGWVVGLFFTNTITTVLAALGVTGVKVWQLGAFLGFVGGFFKATLTQQPN